MTMERLRFSHLLANKSVIGVRNKPFFEEIDEFLTEKKDASFWYYWKNWREMRIFVVAPAIYRAKS